MSHWNKIMLAGLNAYSVQSPVSRYNGWEKCLPKSFKLLLGIHLHCLSLPYPSGEERHGLLNAVYWQSYINVMPINVNMVM